MTKRDLIENLEAIAGLLSIPGSRKQIQEELNLLVDELENSREEIYDTLNTQITVNINHPDDFDKEAFLREMELLINAMQRKVK